MAVTPKHSIPVIEEGASSKEIAINSGMAIIDAILGKRFVVLTLCLGETVAATGARVPQVVVPFSPVDGTTSVTWNVRRINVRLATAGTMTARVEKSTAGQTAVFSAATVGDVAITALSGGSNASGLGTVASGDVLRVNITAYTSGSGATVTVLLEAA